MSSRLNVRKRSSYFRGIRALDSDDEIASPAKKIRSSSEYPAMTHSVEESASYDGIRIGIGRKEYQSEYGYSISPYYKSSSPSDNHYQPNSPCSRYQPNYDGYSISPYYKSSSPSDHHYQPNSPCSRNDSPSPHYQPYSPSAHYQPNSPYAHYQPNYDWEADAEEEINYVKPSSISQPLFPALWAGDFTVSVTNCQNTRPSTTTALHACLASNACTAARREVENFPPTIQWERLPRRSVWPKSFELRSRPSDDDIAVFFFPSLAKHEAAYDSLLFDLIRHDSALMTPVNGSKAELLLFTSVELPHHSMRFQGKLFLWGVIRDRATQYFE